MGDYDDLADRMSDTVPADLTDQSDIRGWLDSNVDLDPTNSVDRVEKLQDEVSRRMADGREGAVTGDGERYFYDPGTGRWRDENGMFGSGPDDRND